jgi:hypothetical protein
MVRRTTQNTDFRLNLSESHTLRAMLQPRGATFIIGCGSHLSRKKNCGSSNKLADFCKLEFIRQLYARLGPEEFLRPRLECLPANRKKTSYDRLIAYVRRVGVEISPHK